MWGWVIRRMEGPLRPGDVGMGNGALRLDGRGRLMCVEVAVQWWESVANVISRCLGFANWVAPRTITNPKYRQVEGWRGHREAPRLPPGMGFGKLKSRGPNKEGR